MSRQAKASNKTKHKSETEVDDVLNYTINKQYLKICRNKFWDLTELMRNRYKPTTQEELKVQKFNQDFCSKHGFPLFLQPVLRTIVLTLSTLKIDQWEEILNMKTQLYLKMKMPSSTSLTLEML